MNRRIATWIVAALFSAIISILVYIGIRPTRSIVIQIHPSAIPHFEGMVATKHPELSNVEILHSPGTHLWMLSVFDQSETRAEQRMQKLADFIGQWGKTQYSKHGVGNWRQKTAITEHERTKGSLQKLSAQYLNSVPFFR
jgi:hypothetical protein